MYHPTRGGVRGGRDQFTWESVKTDKDRECYLGHSLMAPVGRWQEGKDIMWYSKQDQQIDKQRAEQKEFLKAKELEEEALMAALGYRIVKKEKKEDQTRETINFYDEKTHKDSIKKMNDKIISQGPQIIEFDDKHELDRMLTKLLQKFGKDAVFEALGGSKEKKKKKKSKKKSSKYSSESSNESDDSNIKKRKKNRDRYNERSKKRKSRSQSRSSSSSSDSD